MTKNTEPTQPKKRRRWPWITLVVTLALVAIIRLAMRADFVFDYIRIQVEQIAGNQLEGELTIQNMRGDLWNHVEVHGVTITQRNQPDKLATVDSIKVGYNIMSLLASPLVVNDVDIFGLNGHLIQSQDSVWNFEKVLPEGDGDDTESDPFPLRVERTQIHGSNLYVNAPLILPDTSIQILDINMLVGFELFEDGFSFDLDNFEFNLHERRFSDPLRFETTASGDTTAIQLDRLMLSGGATFLEMMGNYDLKNEEVEMSALFDPLSWRAIRAYAEDAPLAQDLSIRITIEGNLDNIRAQFNVTSVGMEQFTIGGNFSLGADPAITNLFINGQNVDFATLLDDPDMPSFRELESSFEGFVSFQDYERSQLDGSIEFTELRMDPYVMDQVTLILALRENEVFTNLELNRANGMVYTEAYIGDLWSDSPEWTADYQISKVNPAIWAADESLEGMINADGSLNGQGFEIGEEPISFQLNMQESTFQDQRFENAQVSGWINNEVINVESNLRTQRNFLSVNANVNWAVEEPTYNFTIDTPEFDISEFVMEDTLATRLNLNITGEGKNFALEEMELTAGMSMDSSFVNNQIIDALHTNITIRDSILVLDNFTITSPFIEGNLNVRQNIIRFDDLDNHLEFNFQLIDIQPFAEIAGAEVMDAQGSVSGDMQQDQFQRLALNVNLELHDIAYDSLTIENIQGRITTTIEEDPDFDLDIAINQPRFGEYSINDMRFLTAGSYANEVLNGNYSFGLIGGGENGLRQRAAYHFDKNTLRITTNELDLVSEDGNYILQNPFDITYGNELITVDTMVLRGERSGAIIQFALDQYEQDGFRGNLETDQADLGLLQDIIFDERFFEGGLTSRNRFDINSEQMDIDSQTLLWNLTYEEFDVDTLRLGLNLADNRLQSKFSVHNDLQTLLTSEFDLPFILADPEELSDDFFEEPISGFVEATPLDLSMFTSLLNSIGFESITGFLTINSTLSGTAGSPSFEGDLSLNDAILSDIPIQEMFLSWDYDHETSNISLNSFLDTATQRAIDLNGNIPFYVDFRTFEFSGPQENDELTFNFRSDNFNLAVFSDFLDPETARDLRGRLNSEITIHGPMDDLAMEGYFRISEGRIRMIPNEVTFRDITVDISLLPDKIILNRASVQSTGTLTGSGEIDLNGLTPEDFNLGFNTRTFKVYGTNDIDAFIGMNTRLEGTLEAPILTGDLSVERGTVYLDDFGGSEVEEVVLEDDNEEDELIPEAENGFYQNLAMEINLSVDRNLNLRNRSEPEMDLALSGDLDLVKLKGGKLEVFGDINIPSGYATTFGKRFDIDTGTIILSGDPADPEMDIRTIYRPRQQGGTQIEIYYNISGTLEEPEFTYSSNPEMEFQDIVSYTLFGRPFNALAGWEQGAAGRSEGNFVSEMAMEVLLDRVEALAADQLGIDLLEIGNSRSGPGSGTSIKAGKFLSDRIFVAFLQELGGTDSGRQVIIEYMMRRNLDLVITGSDDHRSGVDVLWKLDY